MAWHSAMLLDFIEPPSLGRGVWADRLQSKTTTRPRFFYRRVVSRYLFDIPKTVGHALEIT
jgi:hypothetical protein